MNKKVLCNGWVLLFGLAISLTGPACRSINTVENAEKSGTLHPIVDTRVITDRSLQSKVSIIGVATDTTAGGLLKAQIEVYNRTRSAKNFEYRFQWFDMNGMLVKTTMSTYIPRQIEGKERMYIQGIAPSNQAMDFRLQLIESVR